VYGHNNESLGQSGRLLLSDATGLPAAAAAASKAAGSDSRRGL